VQTLADKVAVITGASRGLGYAVAQELADAGAVVVLVSRDEEALETAATNIRSAGGKVHHIACDVADWSAVEELAMELEQVLGRCDLLINNAGIPAPTSMDETSPEDWNRVLGVNLTGAFNMTRALWHLLKLGESGYVINISGGAGKRGGGSPGYGSTKFGLEGLTAAIAASGSPHAIRATALYPGSMDTGWRGAPIGAKSAKEIMDPREVARFIAYLAGTPDDFVVNEAIMNPIAHPWG